MIVNIIIIIYNVCALSRVQLFVAPWAVAHQAPLSMEFSRQEYWSGLSLPTPGDLPDLGVKPTSPVSPALAGRFFTTEPPGKPWLETAVHIISQLICRHVLSTSLA